MIKHIYLFTIILSLCASASAQRMLPGQKAVEAGFGLLSTDGGLKDYALRVGVLVQTGMGHYGFGGLEYARQQAGYRQSTVPLETYLVDAGYSLRILGDFSRFINLNAGLAATAGYERINNGDSLLFDGAVVLDKSHFVYGFGGRLSVETYLTNSLVLLLQARTNVLWGTSRGKLRPSVGIGIRFNF